MDYKHKLEGGEGPGVLITDGSVCVCVCVYHMFNSYEHSWMYPTSITAPWPLSVSLSYTHTHTHTQSLASVSFWTGLWLRGCSPWRVINHVFDLRAAHTHTHTHMHTHGYTHKAKKKAKGWAGAAASVAPVQLEPAARSGSKTIRQPTAEGRSGQEAFHHLSLPHTSPHYLKHLF